MAVTLSSPTFQSLNAVHDATDTKMMAVSTTKEEGQEYWWNTSGRDLANMLQTAKYPENVQKKFLTYFRDNICTLLGGRPDSKAGISGIGWDGNPFEYSFELKSSSKKQSVRFVVDMTDLRPSDPENPLSMATTEKVVKALSLKTPGFDDTWYRALKERMVYAHLSSTEQKELVKKARQQTSVVMGFDIHSKETPSEQLPVLGKVYFLPCFRAAAEGIPMWDAAHKTIKELPQIEDFPNMLKSAQMITDYLSDKPAPWRNSTRWLATDLIAPGQARLKVYLRCHGTTFEEIWDFYTLGGRLSHLDEDRQKFKDLMDMVSGSSYDQTMSKDEMSMDRFTSTTKKLTAIYFSLSPKNPCPTPKLCVYPSNFAANDEVIAQGLDRWFNKYGWLEEGASMENQVKGVFTHRELNKKNGIFTFIGIGRKEDPTKNDLSMQVYLCPELYETPRI